MALDLGLTTRQLLSAMDSVAGSARNRGHRLIETLDRAHDIDTSEAESRTAAVGHRPYISARTGPEGLLDSIAPPEIPADWAAISVDGSHIDVDRHLPLRCFLINLGGCAVTYGGDHGFQGFSEPTLAVEDDDLHLRNPDDLSDEVPISGQLLGALRTVGEVERLADTVESLPDDRPVLALLDGTLAFWDLQRGQYPRFVSRTLIEDRLQCALARLRAASTNRRPVAVAAYTSRPQTTEVPAPSASRSVIRATATATSSAPPAIPTWRPATGRQASTTANCSSFCWNRATARPSTGPATWPPASPWGWPPARSGATSTT